jgi:hypothetical protein
MADQTVDPTKLTPAITGIPISPFLPGTNIQYAWDSTSIGYIKVCPRLYQYTMIDGWAPKDESIHLRFGIEYHQALQEYDISRANGVPHEDAIHDVIRQLLTRVHDWHVDPTTKAGKYKNRYSIIQLVVDYLDHFSHDPAKTYILENGKPAAELSFRFELDWGPRAGVVHSTDPSLNKALAADAEYLHAMGADEGPSFSQPYLLCGHLDRVVDFNDQLLVMDHKTTTTTPTEYYFNQFEPNNQMSLYTLAGKIVLNTPIKGVIIDAAQVLLEKPNKFIRGFTYRTPGQLMEWVHDLHIFLSTAETYAEAGYWPQNDTACDKFGGCKFRSVCSKDPAVRDRFLAADFEKLSVEERWNPLKPR